MGSSVGEIDNERARMGEAFTKGVNGNSYDTNNSLPKYYIEYHMYVQ